MLKALAFNCSLKPTSGKETSSTDALLSQLASQLKQFDVETEVTVPWIMTSNRGLEAIDLRWTLKNMVAKRWMLCPINPAHLPSWSSLSL